MKTSLTHPAQLVRIAHANRGLAAVEFGLIAPVLIALLLGLFDFGLAYQQQLNVNAAAEQGASYAVTNGFDTTQITNVVTRAGGIQASPAPTETCGCPNATSGITASSSPTPPCTVKCPDGSYPGVYVSVTALLSYSTVVPWPGLTNPLQLTSTEMVRIQ
jgi:Flp pilus assembly protein TadG